MNSLTTHYRRSQLIALPVDGMENRRHRLNWEMSRDRCLRLGSNRLI